MNSIYQPFKKIGVTIIITVLLCLSVKAQDTLPSFIPKIELVGYGGCLLIHKAEMEDLGHNPYWGNEIQIGLQSTGDKYWQEVFKYPTYGLGFYSGHFNNEHIGNPFAVYAFIELPFIRKNKLHVSNNLGIGTIFNINEYDSVSNPENIAIGTNCNAYANFSTTIKYKISNRWELGTGIKFQHFSNGSIKKPNLGLNMLSGQVVVSYYPTKTVNEFKKGNKTPPYKKHEFYTVMAMGKNTDEPNGSDIKYLNTTFSIGVNRRINYKRNVGLGFDMFYNEYIKDDLEIPVNEVKTGDLLSYAVFLSSDLIIDKFRLTTQIGTYLYRPTNYSIPIYERIAMRYYFIPNVFANISVKAHGATSQVIEWGVGASF